MSGKKRALIGLDNRIASRLEALESVVDHVQADHRLVQMRIAAFNAEEEDRARAAQSARQQSLSEAMSGVDVRFLKLEAQTTNALTSQEIQQAQRAHRLETDLREMQAALASLAYEMDQYGKAAQDMWHNAQDTLNAARTLADALYAYYPAHLWKTAQNSIETWLEEAEANLYRGLDDIALLQAQQAYLDLQGLRMQMETTIHQQHRMRLAAIQRLNEVLVLAESNAAVQAIDFNGRFIDTWIDVDQWSGDNLRAVQMRIHALLNQVTNQSERCHTLDWHELLEKQIPKLEQAVFESVRKARHAIIDSQLRFNIAEKVVSALAEQGYAVKESGWQDGALKEYQVTLHDYSDNQVTVSVSTTPAVIPVHDPDQTWQLEIQYQSQDLISEHILQRSVGEIYNSLRAAGLNVQSLQKPVLTSPQAKPALMADRRKDIIHEMANP